MLSAAPWLRILRCSAPRTCPGARPERVQRLSAWRGFIIRIFKHVLILDVLCAVVFLSMSALLGMRGGFEHYLLEVSSFTTSTRSVLLYVILLCAYAVTIEYLLRSLQERLSATTGAALMVATLYAVTHLRHGVTGFVYALPIGLITALLYARWGRWRVFALWHVQWDLGALFIFILLSMANVSPFADAVQYTYKAQLMSEGRIVYRADSGWIDTAHYWGTHRRACEFHAALERGVSTHRYTLVYRDLFGIEHAESFSLGPRASPAVDPAEEAKSLTLTAALSDEAHQATASVWSGMRLSAWNPEDIRSVRAALSDIRDPGFWSTCGERTRPMPTGFRPMGVEEDPQRGRDLWPTFEAFVRTGLPAAPPTAEPVLVQPARAPTSAPGQDRHKTAR